MIVVRRDDGEDCGDLYLIEGREGAANWLRYSFELSSPAETAPMFSKQLFSPPVVAEEEATPKYCGILFAALSHTITFGRREKITFESLNHFMGYFTLLSRSGLLRSICF